MNNFWKNKPVVVTNEKKSCFKTILDKNTLLSQINNDIISCKIKLDYNILTDDCTAVDNTLAFINTNYISKGSSVTLKYSRDLYMYFCEGKNICIGFYPKQRSSQMVGFIMGKPIKVHIEGEQIDTLEVNFLCLLPELRSLHVSSYMISVLSKVCLEEFNIVSAVYTVGKKLAISNFCKKHYYHRPLDMTKMIEAGLLNKMYSTTVARKVYSTFNYKKDTRKHIEYYNNQPITEVVLYEIIEKLMLYNKRTFSVFDVKTASSIENLFKNPAFHTFVIKDDTGCIKDMVSIFQLDTVDIKCNASCRNGYVYSYFFDDYYADEKFSRSYKFDVIERISKYCADNKILDMITIVDCFGLSEGEYYTNKFMKGSGTLYYYFYNAEISKINREKNGLVTI